ncbi:hypothetical protein Bca52824_006566 [Brassica carinata]|uniref:Uncharacterized protein n=1 Tax=Brassica carinata TaxID=52824 RepID=A0A8X7W4M1_BRACI|nr:hypothetical protein Bca52824_006566 [Brassica carinata]
MENENYIVDAYLKTASDEILRLTMFVEHVFSASIGTIAGAAGSLRRNPLSDLDSHPVIDLSLLRLGETWKAFAMENENYIVDAYLKTASDEILRLTMFVEHVFSASIGTIAGKLGVKIINKEWQCERIIVLL